MKRMRRTAVVLVAGMTGMLLQSCPAGPLLEECFGEDTISRQEYEDLNFFERQLYEENDCGRYEPSSDFAELFL